MTGPRPHIRTPQIRTPQIRTPGIADLPSLTRLWHDTWHEAHDGLVPGALSRERPIGNFARRLRAMRERTRMVGPEGAPLGLCTIHMDELDQLFVAPSQRGTGLAQALQAEAEDRLRAAGVQRGWLGCALGNTRAARFYQKCGWHAAGQMVIPVALSSGTLDFTVTRFEKDLAAAPAGCGP